jgi:hypothetical protein
MAKVKIQGHASGSGVITVTAPNTSTDRTITLPDTTGTLLDENSSVPAANLTGTVATANIADNAITLAKMASGTDGNIISYDASGNPVAIATGSDGQVLTSTGAGSPPAFEAIPAVSGTILQSIFVQNATDVAFPQNTTTSTTIVSAAITPSATNSKIVIYWSYRGELNGGNYPAVNLALSRTISGSATGLQYEYYIGYMGSTTTHRMLHTPGFYQDTPNTTSEITYYLYGGNTTGSGFSGTYGGHANGNNNKSEILIMEIGA